MMNFTIECDILSVVLICVNPGNLRICVRRGRRLTNALADEIDSDRRFSVQDTAFGKGTASIHFSAYKHTPWQDIADRIARGIKAVAGDPDMKVHIEQQKSKVRDPKI